MELSVESVRVAQTGELVGRVEPAQERSRSGIGTARPSDEFSDEIVRRKIELQLQDHPARKLVAGEIASFELLDRS